MAKGKATAARKKGSRAGEVVPVRAAPVERTFVDPFERFMERFFSDFPRFPWPRIDWPEVWRPLREFELKVPAVDVYEEGDDLVVKADLPGLTKDQVEVNLTDKVLTIKGEKERSEEVKDKDYYRSERTFGSFTRTITLPIEVKADAATATLKDGVLEIRLPKTEEPGKRP
ncbi:MAG: Hsp20/alpha crystallin family protein, partial [candidate division KSB1 bacterium]|nr:Hsp20/alpha crystallin family protein [candidate division KSB1 bacterium]